MRHPLLSVLIVTCGTTFFSPAFSAGAHVAVRIVSVCPTAGSLANCTPVSGPFVEGDGYIVTSVTGSTLSEMATMSGGRVQASASLLQKDNTFLHWWPIGGKKGQFSYAVVPQSGTAITKSVNIR